MHRQINRMEEQKKANIRVHAFMWDQDYVELHCAQHAECIEEDKRLWTDMHASGYMGECAIPGIVKIVTEEAATLGELKELVGYTEIISSTSSYGKLCQQKKPSFPTMDESEYRMRTHRETCCKFACKVREIFRDRCLAPAAAAANPVAKAGSNEKEDGEEKDE